MASLSARNPIDPCETSNQIESSSRSDVLQMRLLLPDRAGTTQTHNADALRDGALNPRPLGVDLGKLLGLFLLAPLLQGEVLLMGTDCDGAARMAKRLGTERSRRAW